MTIQSYENQTSLFVYELQVPQPLLLSATFIRTESQTVRFLIVLGFHQLSGEGKQNHYQRLSVGLLIIRSNQN